MDYEFVEKADYLPEPSDEQLDAIEKLKKNNVVIDSVAGCGKTTTNLYIAKQNPKKKILLLTYNSKLKLETREKTVQHNVHNIEVHSYHSFCVKHYYRECFTDIGIVKVLENSMKSRYEFQYDIIILDEAQDINPLYGDLVNKIFHDNSSKKKPKLCILGDQNQSIYDFNLADPRFITLASKVWDFNKFKWAHCKLSYSFRITHEMSRFINKCMMKYTRIKSRKISGIKPRYIVCNVFNKSNLKNMIYKEIMYYLGRGYLYRDIFILAASVKKKGDIPTSIRILANLLSDQSVPIFIPGSDGEKLDESILSNKIVFSTFHQSKGLERKVVIVVGFDSSYFKYYNRKGDPLKCSNQLYVATTRASEHLTLIQDSWSAHLPFLKIDKINKYCDVRFENKEMRTLFLENNKKVETKKEDSMNNMSVTDLVKHLPQIFVKECVDKAKLHKLRPSRKHIEVPYKTEQIYGFETVSDITGTAIPAYYEYKSNKRMEIYDYAIKGEEYYGSDWHVRNTDSNSELILEQEHEQKLENERLAKSMGYNSEDSEEDEDSEDSEEDENIKFVKSLKNGVVSDSDSESSSDSDSESSSDSDSGSSSDSDDSLVFKHPNKISYINLETLTSSQLLYLASRYDAYKTGFKFKVRQMNKYNWLSSKNLKKCLKRMESLKLENPKFEQPLMKQMIIENVSNIIGSCDCIDSSSLYEFKCVAKLELEHYLQLMLYMYLHKSQNPDDSKKYILYNILSDEMIQIDCDIDVLEKLVKKIIKTKNNGLDKISDKEFVRDRINSSKKYL
jgi:hypothetical protein